MPLIGIQRFIRQGNVIYSQSVKARGHIVFNQDNLNGITTKTTKQIDEKNENKRNKKNKNFG